MEDIETGLQTLIEEVRKRNIRSIAIPPLGCGLGGLPWPDVRSKIEEAFQDLMDVQILLYEPI
jgi:O-acetyl-ADP-ribose deacetylase (regulator of RNase III)